MIDGILQLSVEICIASMRQLFTTDLREWRQKSLTIELDKNQVNINVVLTFPGMLYFRAFETNRVYQF